MNCLIPGKTGANVKREASHGRSYQEDGVGGADMGGGGRKRQRMKGVGGINPSHTQPLKTGSTPTCRNKGLFSPVELCRTPK
eukprot:5192387-Ditylum_brightwellii.AAC.1